MNAELLHDALDHLPGDLIAATDRLRTQPWRRIIPWRRYAALAACLVLTLCSSLIYWQANFTKSDSTESMGQQAPAANDQVNQESKSPAGVYGDGTLREEAFPESPAAGVPAEPEHYAFTTETYATPLREDLSLNLDTHCKGTLIGSVQELEAYLASAKETFYVTTLEAACEAYTSDWFETHGLILLCCQGEAYTPVSASLTCPDGHWVVTIQTGPAINATASHVVMEVGLVLPEDTGEVEIVVEQGISIPPR